MTPDHVVMRLPAIPVEDGRLTICRGPKCYATTQRRFVLCRSCWKQTDELTRDRWKRCREWLSAHPDDGGAMYRLICATNDALRQVGARTLTPEETRCDDWA